MGDSMTKTRSQLGRMSKNKGKVFERTVAKLLATRGFSARRGVQFKGGIDSPDVVCDDLPFIHWEAKAVENLSLYKALEQARADAGLDGKMPVVVHKRNNKPIVAILELSHFLDIIQWAVNMVDDINRADLRQLRKDLYERENNTSEQVEDWDLI